MKLENVEKSVKISMEYKELCKYVNALDNIIDYFKGDVHPEDIQILKDFSLELTKIQKDVTEW